MICCRRVWGTAGPTRTVRRGSSPTRTAIGSSGEGIRGIGGWTWATRIISSSGFPTWLPELLAKGWDGVYIDNAIINPVYYLQSGESIPKYPTQAAYQAATDSFLADVGPQIRAAGLQLVPNLGAADGNGALFARWAADGTGVTRELWAAYGVDGSPLAGWDWNRMMEQIDAVQADGKTFLAISYGSAGNVRLQRYARASFLLGWNGTQRFCTGLRKGRIRGRRSATSSPGSAQRSTRR